MSVKLKREKLIYAITSNVQYLAKLHQANAAELRDTGDRLRVTQEWNEKLQDENAALTEERDELATFKTDLEMKQKELNSMLI